MYAGEAVAKIFESFKKNFISHKDHRNQSENRDCLSTNDKKRIIVEKVTTKDMVKITMMPYDLNCTIQKVLDDKTQPYAYMELNRANQIIAKDELQKLNEHILQARFYIPMLTRDIYIRVDDIAFNEYNKDFGYSKLICTPHTYTGKLSKYPLSLLFMTRLDKRPGYESLGELLYGVDGNIMKADVSIWKKSGNYGQESIGWFFRFNTIGKTFMIKEVKTTLRPDRHGMPGIVYRFEP